MDFDFDYLPPVDLNETLAPSQSVSSDSVKWQSSQVPCPVLKSLMSKGDVARINKSFEPRHILEPGSSTSFHPTTSHVSTTRPLLRTSSRPRLGRYSEPDTRSPLQAPDLNIFNTSDSSQFLDLVKTVAERVDENAGFRAGKTEDLTGVKRKICATNSISAAAGVRARVRKPRLAAPVKDESGINRAKGIRKEDSGTEPEHEGNSSDSLIAGFPHLSSSSFTSASSSSSHSINMTSQMDGMDADTSMCMSTSSRMDVDESVSSDADFAPLPKRRAISRTNSVSSGSAVGLISPPRRNTPTVSPIPEPKLHPLLSQQHSNQRQPLPRAPPLPLARQPPHLHPPSQRIQHLSTSQTSAVTRPPALGMRRTHGAILTSKPPLPTRQKAFKPPLQSQPRPPQSQPSYPVAKVLEKDKAQPVKMESGSSRRVGGRSDKNEVTHQHLHTILQENSSSNQYKPDSNSDPDSSFGDMSFDIDALEETMRKYD